MTGWRIGAGIACNILGYILTRKKPGISRLFWCLKCGVFLLCIGFNIAKYCAVLEGVVVLDADFGKDAFGW